MNFFGVQVFIRTILTLSFLFLLAACGASTSSNEDSAQLGSRSENDITGAKAVSYCNKSGGASLSYKLMAQYTGPGTYDPNIAHVKMYTTPSGFDTNATYIQMWKASASSDSALAYNATPIRFSIYDLQDQKYVKNDVTVLRWDEIKNLYSGATVATFMDRSLFVLNLDDSSGQYTVLSVTAYTASNGQVQTNVNSLLPAFHANPADYAIKSNGQAREMVLQNLHPFKGLSGNYADMALNLCK